MYGLLTWRPLSLVGAIYFMVALMSVSSSLYDHSVSNKQFIKNHFGLLIYYLILSYLFKDHIDFLPLLKHVFYHFG